MRKNHETGTDAKKKSMIFPTMLSFEQDSTKLADLDKNEFWKMIV